MGVDGSHSYHGFNYYHVSSDIPSITPQVTRSVDFSNNVHTDWSETFHQLVSQWQKYVHNEQMEETISLSDQESVLRILDELTLLANDFVYAAKNYGKIIISERCLPDDRKTIRPTHSLCGVAGGEKYVVHGILFKFCLDTHNIYGGDEFAAKAADHELRACANIFGLNIPDIHVPLMCIIDYRGYRLLAVSVLPITTKTLVYGSCDSGTTVYNSDPKMSQVMEIIGKRLNLKPHFVNGELLHGPADCEGHLGPHDRRYLLDLQRFFPPEGGVSPVGKGTHLYMQLRPELVMSNAVPLSSDAFSKFGCDDSQVHDAEVLSATEMLFSTVIPRFVRWIELRESLADIYPRDFSICTIMHQFGVNMRHLGVMYTRCDRRWREVILIEMIARVLKCLGRKLLREAMKEHTRPSEGTDRHIILGILNRYIVKPRKPKGCNVTSWATFQNYEEKKNCLIGHWEEIILLMRKKFKGLPEVVVQQQEDQEFPEEFYTQDFHEGLPVSLGDGNTNLQSFNEGVTGMDGNSNSSYMERSFSADSQQTGSILDSSLDPLSATYLYETVDRNLLLLRLQDMLGIRMSTKNIIVDDEFDRDHVQELLTTVKHLNIFTLAEAKATYLRSLSQPISISIKMLKDCCFKFQPFSHMHVSRAGRGCVPVSEIAKLGNSEGIRSTIDLGNALYQLAIRTPPSVNSFKTDLRQRLEVQSESMGTAGFLRASEESFRTARFDSRQTTESYLDRCIQRVHAAYRWSNFNETVLVTLKRRLFASAISDDWIVLGGNQGALVVYDRKKKHVLRLANSHTTWIHSLAIYRGVIVSSGDRILKHSLRSGRLIGEMSRDALVRSKISCIVIHENNGSPVLLSAEFNGCITLWDFNTCKVIGILLGHTNEVKSISIDKATNIIASVSADTTLRLWDFSRKTCLQIIQGIFHRDLMTCVDIRNGFILTGSCDKTLVLLEHQHVDVQDHENIPKVPLHIYSGHLDAIWCVKWLDNDTFVSGSADKTLRLWNSKLHVCLRILSSNASGVYSCCYDSSSATLVTSSADGSARKWDFDLSTKEDKINSSVGDYKELFYKRQACLVS